MISPSSRGKVDPQQQLRARALGLGPCVRFSKDAREVLIGRSPVSKKKAHSRFSTRKKLHDKTTARVPELISHQPRLTIIHRESHFIIHQRSKAQASKKSRISLSRRMSSFGSLRRRISSFSLPATVSRLRQTNVKNLAASESTSEVGSEKLRRKGSIGLSHISSCLRNKLRRNHRTFQPVIVIDDSMSFDEDSHPLS